ncbi:toxin VasX [Caballeronia sp. LjRoot31]|jgi:hypothetical protein|uniref:toxin VasX n=1 Tax=Caballeronia sp. LjRoot31 TaxID=3342324 RepID=UPI003ECEA5E1
MTDAYKKALQPPHPSEKQVGKAISPPPCQHGVPVYPVRYGITDKPFDAKVFPKLTTADYPALQGVKAYGVRVLRPGCYVYLCYMKDDRMWTQHYQVTADVRFAQIWWNDKDRDSDAPGSFARPDEAGAQPYLLAPEEKTAGTVYVLVSDTILTHRTLYKIETNQGGLRDKLATHVKPAGGDAQPHTFNAVLAGNATSELVKPSSYGASYGYAWSEITFAESVADINRIINGMYIAIMPRKDIVPLAVALQDPIGIASELNYLCHTEVKKRDIYTANNKHKLQSAALINGYFEQIEASSDAKTPDGKKAIDKQKGLVNLRGAQSFKPAYENQIKSFEVPIKNAGLDVIAWMRWLDSAKLLGKALSAFDLSCVRNAFDYEIAVLNCIGASVHTDDGLAELAKLIEARPRDSAFWLAMGAGDIPLMDRLYHTLNITKATFTVADKYVETRAATAATNILAGMVQHYVATAPMEKARVQVLRLRHVAERRFNVTLGFIEVTADQFARYTLEMQGYMAMGPDAFARWHLDMSQAPGPLSGTTQVQGHERIEVFEWETIATATVSGATHAPSRPMELTGNPLLRNLKRLRDTAIVKADPLRAPAGVAFTGIGGVLALWTMRGAVQDIRKAQNLATVAAIAGAALGIVGSSIEITTLGISMFVARRGNAVLASTIVKLGFKWGTTYAGGAAAAVMAVADGIKAVNASNDGNPELAHLYLGSALSGGVLALATVAGGSASLATAAAGGEVAAAVLGLTPVGWFVIAVVAVGAYAYFNLSMSGAQQSPVELLLSHSAWGIAAKRYNFSQEMEAWHSLQFRPQLVSTWESAYGHAGTLRLRCTLPGNGGGDFCPVLSITLRGQPLQEVDVATATHTPGGYLNLDSQCVVGRLSSDYGVERGWEIAMHEDAQAEVTYLYRPDPGRMPDIALEQPDAPKPLVFTREGATESDRVAPVRVPV